MIPPRIVSVDDFPTGKLRFSKDGNRLRTGKQKCGPEILSNKDKGVRVIFEIDPSTGISFEGGDQTVEDTVSFEKNEQKLVRLDWRLETKPSNPQKDDVNLHVKACYTGESKFSEEDVRVKLIYLDS